MRRLFSKSSILIIFILTFLFRNNIINLMSYFNSVFNYHDNSLLAETLRIENLDLKNELDNITDLYDVDNYNLKKINTRIFINNIYNSNNIVLNKGEHDKVSIGSPVINNKGLVGVISKVTKNTSTASLIHVSNISVVINDEYGVLNYKNNELIVKNIYNAKINDIVYTSGLSNIPYGIITGYVYRIYNDYVIIRSKVNFDKLSYLTILERD